MVAAAVAGLISTWLIAATGERSHRCRRSAPATRENVLRPVAVVIVVLPSLWFGALAASRVEKT
jgi:hypothetical protein